MRHLFKLTDYSLSYPDQPVLVDVSLSIEQGEKVAIVGQSGAGKSTLLNVLFAQQPDQSAYCVQDRELIFGLSCYNNIYLAKLAEHTALQNLLNLLKPNPRALQKITVLAQQLAIEDKLHVSVNKLSGGQQQRVAVARACYQQKPVFLGDEPVSNLDALKAQQVLEVILNSHQTSIIALHDRHLALQYFDRIVGLKAGKIVIDKPAAKLCIDDLDQLYL